MEAVTKMIEFSIVDRHYFSNIIILFVSIIIIIIYLIKMKNLFSYAHDMKRLISDEQAIITHSRCESCWAIILRRYEGLDEYTAISRTFIGSEVQH